MAAMEKTVDRVLSGDDDDVGASAARRLALLDVARAVQKLRSDIFGGPADAGGMPKRGALTDLREQVEGINTNLGKRVKAVEGSQSAGARSAAQTAAVTETRRLLRELGIYPRPSLWQRLRRLFRKDT